MSNYYQQHQQPYYDYEPQHQQYHHQNNYQHDAYAMHDMTRQANHDADYYPQYEAKPQPAADGIYGNSPQPLLSEQQYASPYIESEKFSRAHRKNRSCCDKICCGCCTCCPRWCRWISCILLLIIIGLGIAVGVLAALFKVPSVQFKGIQGEPAFGLAGTTVNLNASLGFVVNNPNLESVTFKTLVATANYHGDTTELGGGTLNNVYIGPYSVTNISFPFAISMNVLAPETQSVVSKLMSDCGVGGAAAQDINLDYRVVATISILGIPISIPYSNSVSFKCPINDASQSSLLNEIATLLSSLAGGGANNLIGGLTSSIPTAAIPSNVANLIPSNIPSAIAGLAGGQ